jgi:uncharacterized protein
VNETATPPPPETLPSTTDAKAEALRSWMASRGSVVVAYSGGVDSALVAAFAHDVLGERALAVTAESESYPAQHRQMALDVARAIGLHHEFIRTYELERPEYRANPTNRCYYCKHELFSTLTRLAGDRGFHVVVDGANADDRGDYRPGRDAAREFGVLSPLDEVGLTKADIRAIARERGLPTWDAPASACLSSRIPYHSDVTPEKLRTIEQAECVLRDLGFRVFRVRHHDAVARVELARDEMLRALDPVVNASLVSGIKAAGYQFVALDLQGYRLGSLNEPIRLQPL